MANFLVVALTCLLLFMSSGCGCGDANNTSDVSQTDATGQLDSDTELDDGIKVDVGNDPNVGDDGGRDTDAETIRDVLAETMYGEVCGSFEIDEKHIDGNPCDVEGESACIDEGSYAMRLTSDGSWVCTKTKYAVCARNDGQSLAWKIVSCSESISRDYPNCTGAFYTDARCIQDNGQTVCCPLAARTHAAATGTFCNPNQIGASRCIPFSKNSDRVMTCNFLSDAELVFPEEMDAHRLESDECDSVYAACSYWYYSDVCDELDDCHSDACEKGFDEYGDPYKICYGQCIYDSVKDLNRCATSCQDLVRSSVTI